LVALSLDTQNISISQGSMSEGALPNLKSISVRCGTEVPANPLLSNVIPEDVARNLAYFSTSITTDCLSIIENMKSLRVAPDLEKLYVVPSTPWRTEYFDDKSTPQFISGFIHILKLTKLTHLGGFMRDVPATTIEGKALLSQLKNVTYVEIMVPVSDIIRANQSAWVELQRDEEGNFLGYHKIANDVGVHNWGNFFHGIV